jgi:SUN domain-containing protein 1/2
VIHHSETFDPLGGWFARALSVVNPWKPYDRAKLNDPSLVITSKLEPGECWAMTGSSGYVTIRLSTSIIPDSIFISHVAIQETMHSALRDFKLFGHKNDWNADKPVEIMTGTFDAHGSRTQEFTIPEDMNDSYQIFSLKVLSNHGQPDYTCLYRVKIFGQAMEL